MSLIDNINNDYNTNIDDNTQLVRFVVNMNSWDNGCLLAQ